MMHQSIVPGFSPIRWIFLAVLMALVWVGTVGSAFAQDPLAEQRQTVDQIKRDTAKISDEARSRDIDDAGLVKLRLSLDEKAKELLKVGVSFRPRLSEINSRLEQLGAPPAEGQPPEQPNVTDERNRLQSEKVSINALLGETEDTSVQVNSLIEEISLLRRDLFANTLSQRVDLNRVLSSEVSEAASQGVEALSRLLSSWWRFVTAFKQKALITALAAIAIVALGLMIGSKKLFGELYMRDPDNEDPSDISKLSVAFWSTLIPSATLGIFLVMIYLSLSYFGILRTDVARLLTSLSIVIGIVYFVQRLGRAVLSPDLPQWRLVNIATGPAWILLFLMIAMSVVTGLDYLLTTINELLSSPLSITVAKSLIASIFVGIFIVAVATIKPRVDKETGEPKPWPRAIRLLIYALGLAPILTALLGYIGLARFLSQQIVVSGAFLVTMYLGFHTARAISKDDAFGSTSVGRGMRERFGLDDTTLDQLGLAAGIILNIFVVLLGVPLILLQFGFQWSELTAWFLNFATGFQVGSVRISLVAIATGIGLFTLFYFFTRWFQNWLDGSVMSRGRLDAGVRNSIKTTVGYVGLGISALIGISAAGFNLSNLALVAGALSLGIGFGLQNIVSNFVSGLILLAERPFKVGDWVEAGGVSGIVKKISVRATEVETFQRQSIIIPNSEFINAQVGNWTHRNKLGRVDIPVGVSYEVDPRRVHDLLLEIGRDQPTVLRNPEPFVAFQNLADSTMNFELRVHVADISNAATLRNDIRFAIVKRFGEEGIDIPFPQRDVNLHFGDAEPLVELMAQRVRESLDNGKMAGNGGKKTKS